MRTTTSRSALRRAAPLCFDRPNCVPTLRLAGWIVCTVAFAGLAGCKSGGLLARKQSSTISIESVPDALAALRESRDPVARWMAVEYLGEPRHVDADRRAEVSDILALAVSVESEPNARIHILQSLDELGSPKRAPALLEAAKDKDASVRATACRLLGRANVPTRNPASVSIATGPDYTSEVTESLDTLLVSDTNLDVRLAAAEALGHLPNQQSALALVGGISDSDVAIRFRCRESLKRITGKDYSGDVGKWREEIQTANFEELAGRRRGGFLW